jgi:molecular chaperone GrpE
MADNEVKEQKTPVENEGEEGAVEITIESEEETAKDSSDIQGGEENGGEAESEDGKAVDPEEKIKQLEAEVKENYDRLLRASAEFDNYKKRSAREMESFRKFANESLIKDLLPIIDNLERAIISSTEHEDNDNRIAEGVDLTLKEILKTLSKYGVSTVEAMHEPFDPNFHEAVMREPSGEHPDNTVVRELQKGYMLHDRLLRPAMVAVSMAGEDKTPTPEAEDDREEADKNHTGK